MANALRKRASKQSYVSVSQLKIEGFTIPFEQQLDPYKRWVVLSFRIPWDLLVSIYNRGMRNTSTGAQGINPRVVVGHKSSNIFKHGVAVKQSSIFRKICTYSTFLVSRMFCQRACICPILFC